MTALTAHPCGPLAGEALIPGDKSLSHRALMLGALAVGETRISGLLESEDVLATAAALRALGVEVERRGPGRWRVFGRGVSGQREPETVLDFGNAGTGARLMMGLLAGQPLTAVLTGDASLRSRPMGRIFEPLSRMGVQFQAREGGRLPATLIAPERLRPISYLSPVASAQIKSAVLFAGLAAPGETTVIEPLPSRDHSERMLAAFGARLRSEDGGQGHSVTVAGEAELTPQDLAIARDPSSAAFPLVAALIVPGSRVVLPGIGVNPLRCGLFETLREMGAKIAFENRREEAGEPLADLVVEAGVLTGVEVPAARAPAMIDEYPILAVAAACAEGRTAMHGLGELRVKESDRLAAVAEGLAACGVAVEAGEDSLIVEGQGRPPRGGAAIAARLDHRIAMSFLVLGLAAERAVSIDDAAPIETSFTGFPELLCGLGARIGPAGE
ncbi:MAG: 3-phosphoshikimate 1-carboxyvinyltransferase [Rhodovibrionaceae bacterium]